MPSKKRSGTKPPPEPLVVFLDRSLGREPIRTRLVALGITVELHDDHFARDEKDEVWLAEVAQRHWIVFTKDQRIRYRPLEKAALAKSGARIFVLTAGNLKSEDIARAFVDAIPEIPKIVARQAGAFVAHVTASGHVRVIE